MITKCNGMQTSGITTEYIEELGLSGLASTLSSLPTKKATSKGGGSGTKGKSSVNNARQGEGSDLSDYIPEIKEPDDGDDDTDLEEEATPLANEVHFLSWLRGRDARLHISNAYRSRLLCGVHICNT